MTANETTNAEAQNQKKAEKSKLFKSFVTIFTAFGVLGILAGLLHFSSAISSGFSGVALPDAIFNTLSGVLNLICSRILAKGKALAIWIFSFTILSSIIYSFFIRRGFNFIIAVIGTSIIWQLFTFKKQGEIS